MRLPVTTAAADPDALWRRYADLLFDRALARGEAADNSGERSVVTPSADWVFLSESSNAMLTTTLQSHGGRPKPTILVRPPAAAGDQATAEPPDRATRIPFRLYRLVRAIPVDAPEAFAVLPGRAARAAYADLCGQRFAECGQTFVADAAAHLDDTQFDPLVVLEAGRAIAMAGLQSRGQSGGVFDLYVRPEHRRRGLGRLLIGRVLELAARSQQRDVFASAPPGDPACDLFERFGFVAVLSYEIWTAAAGSVSASQTFT